MPVSEKQLAANRKNARKSTGPRTPKGKAVARRNALKRGFYATDDIIVQSNVLEEDKAEYDLLLSSLYDELAPTTIFQEYLVRKIANCLWRSRRALIAETSNINQQLNDLARFFRHYAFEEPEADDDDPDSDSENEPTICPDRIGINSIPFSSTSSEILYYEMRLDRQMARAFKLLKHLQFADQRVRLPDDTLVGQEACPPATGVTAKSPPDRNTGM